MLTYDMISAVLILLVTLSSGFYPFFKKKQSSIPLRLPAAEAMGTGVFLGAGIIHMLSDSASQFSSLHIEYPLTFLLAGITFILLLYLEHIGKELHHHKRSSTASFAILSTTMLSIHSFLAGAALGFANSVTFTVVILIAILSHKWVASFSLALQITKSDLNFKKSLSLFIVFSLMAPLGVIFGSEISSYMQASPLIVPTFTALAAGTFIYLGSLHGLERGVLVKECCNLKMFYFVILGFSLMAIVAIWT